MEGVVVGVMGSILLFNLSLVFQQIVNDNLINLIIMYGGEKVEIFVIFQMRKQYTNVNRFLMEDY